MVNTENVDGAKAPSPEPEPRVTNDSEGGKKQKEAVKRLSDYSKEVMARKERDSKPVEVVEEPPKVEEVEEVEKSGWELSTGNTIAAVGVGVAMICLYLSYFGKKERFTVPGPVTVVKKSDEDPKPAKSTPTFAKRVAAEPKFRRL